MTTPSNMDTFGGIKVDEGLIRLVASEMPSDDDNLRTSTIAQMTCVASKAWVHFPTATSNGAITPSAGRCENGVGSGALPAVARTATGTYTLTYAANWIDELGNVEPVIFNSPEHLSVLGSTRGDVQVISIASNVVTVGVFDPSTNTLSDLGGGITVVVHLK